MVVKFLGKCLLLLLIVYALFEATIFFSPFKESDLETDFAAAIIDKQEILKNTPSPKIVLIGGSSVSYGIDSKLMSDSLGVPVINMSYQYFLGSDFLFNQILESLHEGDKVIASFEYIVSKDGDKKEQLKAATYYPKAKDWIFFQTPTEYISAYLRTRISFFKRVFQSIYDGRNFKPTVADKTSTFFRGAIDSRGDLVSHLNNDPEKFDECLTTKDTAYYEVINSVKEYSSRLKDKSVTVYFSFPSYEENSFANDTLVIKSIYEKFKTFPEINLLDSPSQNVFPNAYFQDMCYHLNAVGREKRTLELIKNYKNFKKADAI